MTAEFVEVEAGTVRIARNFAPNDVAWERRDAAVYVAIRNDPAHQGLGSGYTSLSLEDAKIIRDGLSRIIESVERLKPGMRERADAMGSGAVIRRIPYGSTYVKVGDRWYNERTDIRLSSQTFGGVEENYEILSEGYSE